MTSTIMGGPGAASTARGLPNTWLGGVEMPDRTCSLDGCEKPMAARGWCYSHYARWKRWGDPLGGRPRRWASGASCSIPDCGRRAEARGWCQQHYFRWRRHGDPSLTLIGPDNQDIGYSGAHSRVQGSRGPATNHGCEHCGRPALNWAYDHSDPDERVEGGLVYSTDPARYMPLCIPCHKRFDLGTPASCSLEGCDRPHMARGFCVIHYGRWRKDGDPGPAEIGPPGKRIARLT